MYRCMLLGFSALFSGLALAEKQPEILVIDPESYALASGGMILSTHVASRLDLEKGRVKLLPRRSLKSEGQALKRWALPSNPHLELRKLEETEKAYLREVARRPGITPEELIKERKASQGLVSFFEKKLGLPSRKFPLRTGLSLAGFIVGMGGLGDATWQRLRLAAGDPTIRLEDVETFDLRESHVPVEVRERAEPFLSHKGTGERE